MRGIFRPARILWALGLALLVATAAGAGWMLNHSSASGVPGAKDERDSPLPFAGKFIIAFGYVDVRPGITKIYPLVPGHVEWVAAEGEFVPKGKELLRLRDKLARSDLKKAEIALADAHLVLNEANKLSEKHDLSVQAQQSAINAAEAEKEAAKGQVAKVQNLVDKGIGGSKYDLESAKAQVVKAEAQVEAQKVKLDILKKSGPEDKIKRANLDVDLKTQLVEHAKLALAEYTVTAPTDGTVLRAWTSVGETLGPNPKVPAIEFCPKMKRLVRTEVLQEYAERVKVGQDAIIEDDSSAGHRWKGKVIRISDWFTHKRSIIQEPFQFNDVRTLECLVEVIEEPQAQVMKIGQRMRVMINQGGP